LATPDEGERRWLVLPAELESLAAFQEFVREGARSASLPEERLWKLELALEEALVNVFRYAYPPGRSGPVEVGWSVEATGRLSVTIRDTGQPFDPLAREPPDLTSAIESRPEGGLGIYLLRQVTDGVAYRREEGMNQLTFHFRP